MSERVVECCPLFTEARYAKNSSIVEGWFISRKGQGLTFGDQRKYAFSVPATGRGKERKLGRNIEIAHCPFCGSSPPQAAEREFEEKTG